MHVLYELLGSNLSEIARVRQHTKLNRQENILNLTVGDFVSDSLHSVHEEIAEIFDAALPSNCSLIRDEACGGKQHIPLFCTIKKSRATEYCNVDLLVLKENKIKIIVEIEESNVKPTQICGKFLTSALASYYIHDSTKNEPVGMDDYVTFVQIVDTSGLVKEKTSKYKQWKALEGSIRKIIPLKNSRIAEYRLFSTDEKSELFQFIKEVI